MNPAASEPAPSEVEGTAARKRNIFAETTIPYRAESGEVGGLTQERRLLESLPTMQYERMATVVRPGRGARAVLRPDKEARSGEV